MTSAGNGEIKNNQSKEKTGNSENFDQIDLGYNKNINMKIIENDLKVLEEKNARNEELIKNLRY